MSKRIPKEFLGAFKKGHRQSVREFIDEDLAFKLLEKVEQGCEEARSALLWLTKFNNEFHKDFFNKDEPDALHNGENLRLECSDRLRLARRDMYSYFNKIKKQGDDF